MNDKIKFLDKFKNNLGISLIYFVFAILLSSCSSGAFSDANLFLHIQKGISFNNYLKQNEIKFDEDTKEYKYKYFKFNYQNKILICHLLQIANVKQESSSSSTKGNHTTTSTTYNYYGDNYFVITDDSKDLIVEDGFYKYEILNGTRNESYKDMFTEINKAYLSYLVEKKIYSKEQIKKITDEAKLYKISL